MMNAEWKAFGYPESDGVDEMKCRAVAFLISLALVGCRSKSGPESAQALHPPALVSSADHVPSTPPTTRPSAPAHPTTNLTTTYSAERFRLVNQKDEVVSVLE